MGEAARMRSHDPRARSPGSSQSDGGYGWRDQGTDGMSEPLSTKIGQKALAAEKARLARFFQTINKHRQALDLAIEENFGEGLDPTEWRNVFDSPEPRDANRTMGVTGDHSAMLNAYVEILNGLYILEGRLEHASPDVDAEEVRYAVERLREAFPELVESARAWLHRHGVELQ